jgi:protein required for attachment to host cells
MPKKRKLIVVMNSSGMRMFEAVGFKVIKEIESVTASLSSHAHKERLKREGYYGKLSTQTHFFDPRTELKQVERHENAGELVGYIKNFLKNNLVYQKVIVIAEPKMLGEFRRCEDKVLWSLVTKEIPKDLMQADILSIEEIAFK